MEIVDINGDGELDVALSTTSSNDVGWLENQGGASAFTEHLITNTYGFASIEVADLNGDTYLDVALRGSDVRWYASDGEPDFTLQPTVDGEMVDAADTVSRI